jgi:DNA-binding MarR family transcriptional regulator
VHGNSELSLRVTEHEVLANLALMPGMTQQALATRCFVAKSGISMLLTRLEEQANCYAVKPMAATSAQNACT